MENGFNQVNSILEKGSKSESVLSFGANYSNKLYLGASLVSPHLATTIPAGLQNMVKQ
jgi:hypothetical protein